jgi:hypothetical protein
MSARRSKKSDDQRTAFFSKVLIVVIGRLPCALLTGINCPKHRRTKRRVHLFEFCAYAHLFEGKFVVHLLGIQKNSLGSLRVSDRRSYRANTCIR